MKSRFLLTSLALVTLALAGWHRQLSYGFHVLLRHGGTYWIDVAPDSPRLSRSMRLALRDAPDATPGDFAWQSIAPGFDVADLPVSASDEIVDHILLARIDPARYRFVLRNAPAGDRNLDDWMTQLDAALVVNGSYFTRTGEPDTPVLSDGVPLGPSDYDAKAGAFVAGDGFAGIRDLAGQDWRSAFRGADNATVSFPLLVAEGENRVKRESNWLANRSFVGQDSAGRVLIGTTTDAFFSLGRLAKFLLQAPLDLTSALNLDGGPVACQGIALNGYRRMSYGRWEAQTEGGQVRLLTWPYGSVAMPVVLAVLPMGDGALPGGKP
ncbi:MAG: phosphodiester glycosidase family protein [Aliidongia sp.]